MVERDDGLTVVARSVIFKWGVREEAGILPSSRRKRLFGLWLLWNSSPLRLVLTLMKRDGWTVKIKTVNWMNNWTYTDEQEASSAYSSSIIFGQQNRKYIKSEYYYD